MKIRTILFTLIQSVTFSVFSQINTVRSYTSAMGDQITLKDNLMIITTPKYYPLYSSVIEVPKDTLAICRIEQSANQFIKAYSIDVPSCLFNSCKVEYMTSEDSSYTQVRFSLPNLKNKIRLVLLHYLNKQDMESNIFKNSTEIMMDSITNYCTINLPQEIFAIRYNIHLYSPDASDFTGAYYGMVEYPGVPDMLPPIILKSHNIKITLPNINKNTLSRWFFWGDYLFISESEIRWRFYTFNRD